jgi:hypothetical protein
MWMVLVEDFYRYSMESAFFTLVSVAPYLFQQFRIPWEATGTLISVLLPAWPQASRRCLLHSGPPAPGSEKKSKPFPGINRRTTTDSGPAEHFRGRYFCKQLAVFKFNRLL